MAGEIYVSRKSGDIIVCGCNLCPNTETIDAIIAGSLVSCLCKIWGAPGIAQYVSHTGISGAFTATLVAPGDWRVLIGTWTYRPDVEECNSPHGDPVTVDVYLELQCSEIDGQTHLNVRITSGPPNFFAGFYTEPLVADAFDVALENELACEAALNSRPWFWDGSITLSL